MKKTLFAILLLTIIFSSACSSEKVNIKEQDDNIWLTNLEKAQEKAKAMDVPILVNFTGSDWCQWCFKIRDEIFSKEEFLNYAKDNLVLLKLDFPRNIPQSEVVKNYNRTLMEKYKIRGFPTILVLDAEGEVLSQAGYQPGGPAAFIKTIEESISFVKDHKNDTYTDNAGLEWFLLLEKAKEIAQKDGKPILVNFTGSDWCTWCFKIRDEIFSKKEFIEYAKKNLVLLRFDFPRTKEQSAGLKAYNQQIAEKFGIKGLPTILLLDKEGSQIAQLGYQEGGPTKYIETIKENLNKIR
ncbi:MAG TPA: DUF255 domain-containing protein [Candidatus Cloacimonetes bacterium]|nr:DUF255 domain-containing protein [Candidatus Cloacimonadota bacterium]